MSNSSRVTSISVSDEQTNTNESNTTLSSPLSLFYLSEWVELYNKKQRKKYYEKNEHPIISHCAIALWQFTINEYVTLRLLLCSWI